MKIQDILFENNSQLQALVSQDQAERKAYERFVATKANGDWSTGAKLYAKYKNRSPDDIFNEKSRLQKFISTKFNFNTFSKNDWNNYWVLAQHCDFNREFQKQALAVIEKYLSKNSSEYKYLADRISCGCTGTQQYGTQDICNKDSQSETLNEVNMSPGSLKNFMTSEFAEDLTIGFEFELIVPGLEDISGHNSGDDKSKDEPFPMTPDWKEKVYNWIMSGNDHSTPKWISTQLNNLEKEFENSKIDAQNSFITSAKGIKKIKTEISNIIGTKDRTKILSHYSAMDNIYVDAVNKVKKDFINSTDVFSKLLKSKNISTMGDFCNYASLKYPYKFKYKHTTLVKKLSKEFSKATKFDSDYSKIYHDLIRDSKTWIFEPDSSVIDSTREGAGIELVSPPMDFVIGIEALNKVWDWVKSADIKTNETTGMHVGISLPNHSMANIDYVKLILFLGDDYILKTFNRLNNEYAQSMLNSLKLKSKYLLNTNHFLDIIKNGINKLAKNIAFKSLINVNDSKYVTVNIKSGYIEFRSVGGDYLSNKNLVLNTIARYIKALAIASDFEAEKSEYAKKLYKLLASNDTDINDPINLFVKYATGQISKEELKLALKTRKY